MSFPKYLSITVALSLEVMWSCDCPTPIALVVVV